MAWRKDPRPEDHRALHVPWVNWDVDYRHYKWHFWKFGYKQEDIFGSLHAEYNCMAFAIQDPYAWHTDVCQLSIACKNREEFHAALIKRRDERFKEIRTAWLKTQDELGGDPRSWESPNLNRSDRWGTFINLARNFSFDCILAHFGNYLLPENEPVASISASQPLRQPEERQELDEPMPDSPLSPPPPLPPLPPPSSPPAKKDRAMNTRNKATSHPSTRSRVEKPPRKRRTSKANAPESIRRSARLQDALEGVHGSVRLQDGPEGEGIRRSARLQKRAARGS